MKPIRYKTSFPISIRQTLLLVVVGYLAMPILLALPLIISKTIGISLAEKIGLNLDNFYIFILISSAFSLLFCSIIIAIKLRRAHLSWNALGFRTVSIKRSLKYVFGFPIMIIVFTLLIAGLLSLVGVDASKQNSTQSDFGPLWASIVVTVIFAPVIEEVLFRGILLQQLLARMRAPAAIIVSGLIFAVAHIDPVRMIMVLPLGLYIGYTYYRLNSIWPGIFIHTGWNLLATLAMASS